MAILPLRALAPTPEGNHIGLGIADSMITKLGGTGALTVRPTSAIHRYAREEVDSLEAARQLRVDAVLEGSWRRDGDRLRVSAHLLRTRDGTTLWADTLDMRWSDIFTIEDQLSQQIIQRLRLALDPAGRARLAKRHTSSPEAYEYYTKAVYLFGYRSPTKRTSRESTCWRGPSPPILCTPRRMRNSPTTTRIDRFSSKERQTGSTTLSAKPSERPRLMPNSRPFMSFGRLSRGVSSKDGAWTKRSVS